MEKKSATTLRVPWKELVPAMAKHYSKSTIMSYMTLRGAILNNWEVKE